MKKEWYDGDKETRAFGISGLLWHARQGQSLIEILVAVLVGVLLFAAAAALIAPILRSNTDVARSQTALALGKELLDSIVVLADENWATHIASLAASSHYYIASTTPRVVLLGDEQLRVATTSYTRYFYVEDVNRNYPGGGITISGGIRDPATKKVTVAFTWDENEPRTIAYYLSRTRTTTYVQTDWAGGATLVGSRTVATTTNAFAAENQIAYASSTGALTIFGVSPNPEQPPIPAPQQLLTIESEPTSNLTIAANPADVLGAVNAVTTGTLTYYLGSSTSLTAPATDGANNNFYKWRKNGVDYDYAALTNVTVDGDMTLRAVYAVRLAVQAGFNGVEPVFFTINKIDKDGLSSGTYPVGGPALNRYYNFGDVVGLSAPAVLGPNYRCFAHWKKNGVQVSTNTFYNVTLNTLSGITTMTAQYSACGGGGGN